MNKTVDETNKINEEEDDLNVFTINTCHAKMEGKTLREVMKVCKYKETKTTGEGHLLWYCSSLREIDQKILNYRKCFFNRYPKASYICRKRQFHLLLNKYQKLFPDEFDFIPKTYVLPEEYKKFKQHLEGRSKCHYIAKPSKGKGGEGIFFVKQSSDMSRENMRQFEYIAQEYVANPLLIDNKKFDLRLYLLVKGVDTMEAYIAFEGMARFCTEDYVLPKRNKKGEVEEEIPEENLKGHLTNYCLNKQSEKFVYNSDFLLNDNGTKRLLTTIFHKIEEMGGDTDEIRDDIRDICTKVSMALQPYLVNTFHTEMGVGEEVNQNCFQIFGLDVLLDENYKCWLMEINCFPSMNFFHEQVEVDAETGESKVVKVPAELDKYLKPLLLKDTIKIVRSSKIPKNSIFEQVFPPQDFPEDYKDYTIFNDMRVLFELLAGFRKPDLLTLSQFQKICYFPDMKTEKLGKPEYATIFATYAKRGNKSLMTLDNFYPAMEHLAKELNGSPDCRPLVKKMIAHIMSNPKYT